MSEGAGPYTARCSRTVDADPSAAWALWADPELLATWMAHRESGGADKPRLVAVDNVVVADAPGGHFRLDMITRAGDGSERTWVHEGRVLEYEPGRRLAVTWLSEGTEHRETRLTLSFSGSAAGTEVELLHEGFITEEMARAHTEGWDIFMELFNEAVMSAAGAALKLGAAELKRRLQIWRAERAAEAAAEERQRSEAEGAGAESEGPPGPTPPAEPASDPG